MTGREPIDRIIELAQKIINHAHLESTRNFGYEIKKLCEAMSTTDTNISWWVEYKGKRLKCPFTYPNMDDEVLAMLLTKDNELVFSFEMYFTLANELTPPDSDRPIVHFECNCGGGDIAPHVDTSQGTHPVGG